MAEDTQGYLPGSCSSFLTCCLHFALLSPYTISNYFQFPCPPLFNTPPKNCYGSPQSELHFGGKEPSVFISRRLYRCYCGAFFCEVSASLACLEKESIKNQPEQLFRSVFLLPADSRQACCRSEWEGLYCCLLQVLFSALNKTCLFSLDPHAGAFCGSQTRLSKMSEKYFSTDFILLATSFPCCFSISWFSFCVWSQPFWHSTAQVVGTPT